MTTRRPAAPVLSLRTACFIIILLSLSYIIYLYMRALLFACGTFVALEMNPGLPVYGHIYVMGGAVPVL
jgi:hypothetical protein